MMRFIAVVLCLILSVSLSGSVLSGCGRSETGSGQSQSIGEQGKKALDWKKAKESELTGDQAEKGD